MKPIAARRLNLQLLALAGGVLAGLLVGALAWAVINRNAGQQSSPAGAVARPAPDFALPGLNGATVRLSAYRGKVVLVNFWATWCVPCREEAPALQAAYTALQSQGFVIIGVNLRHLERSGADGDADVRAFVNEFGITYPIALDVDGATMRAFQVSPIPTSFVVDRNGVIRAVRLGKLSVADIKAQVTPLLQGAAQAASS